MKQLVKNELIKLRAQKAYLVLSCLVLAIVIVVSFLTSVALTPFMNLINHGSEFITRSAGYAYVVDYIYENPDSALAGVLRTVFRDPKSDGDIAREDAEEYFEMGYYGDYEWYLAAARFYDFRDDNDLPPWISDRYQGLLIELYQWHSIVQGMQSGKYTEEMFLEDYSLQSVMYVSFMDLQYYVEYSYDEQTGKSTNHLCRADGTKCSYAEVLQALTIGLPVCESEIERMEKESLSVTVDDYYEAHLDELEGRVLEMEALIVKIRETLKDPTQALTDYEVAYYEHQIQGLQGQIEDCKQREQAYRYLRESGKDPDSNAYAIVNQLLPNVLSTRRDAIDSLEMGELLEDNALIRKITENSAKHKIRVLDKAIVGIEYLYTRDIMPEGMGQSNAKDTFINNLSTAAFLLTAVTVVLASMILSREFATGTVRLWVIRPKTRTKLLASKMITLLIYVASMMLVCFGITYLLALVNHLLDLFFYGESTLFAPVYGVVFGQVVAIPAVLEHLWALIVLTLPVLLFAALCLFISVLTKNGVIGIVLGMIVLMFSSDIQAVTLVVANITGVFGYVLQATVLPYMSMDTLLGTSLDFAVSNASYSTGLLDILDLKGMLMNQLWGAMPYECSSLVGVIVLIAHIALLIWASLAVFKRTQIKS